MHKATVLFLAVAVGLGFICLHLVGQLEAERANAQTLQARVMELERAAASHVANRSAAVPATHVASPFTSGEHGPEPGMPAQRQVAEQSGPPAAVAPANNDAVNRQIQESVERQRALLRDPAYREATLLQYKMAQERSNPGLAKELGLTPAEANELFTLLAEQQLRDLEVAELSSGVELPADKAQELQRRAQEYQQKSRTELADLLGPKFAAWQEYESTRALRWQAEAMRNTLASRGIALEERLAKPLLKTLVAFQEQEQYSQRAAAAGGTAADSAADFAEQMLEPRAAYYERLRAALDPILSDEQLAALEREHDAELQMQRAHIKVLRAQEEAGGADPVLTTGAIDPMGRRVKTLPSAPSPD